MKQTLVAALALVSAMASSVLAEERRYVVTVAPEQAERGFEKLTVSRATVGAAPIRIWANTAINPDCSVEAPGATLAVLSPPSHGAARVTDEPYFASFPPANPRAACNNRKVPGNQAFYTAAAGFAGHDRVVLRGTGPDGRVREIAVNIDVR